MRLEQVTNSFSLFLNIGESALLLSSTWFLSFHPKRVLAGLSRAASSFLGCATLWVVSLCFLFFPIIFASKSATPKNQNLQLKKMALTHLPSLVPINTNTHMKSQGSYLRTLALWSSSEDKRRRMTYVRQWVAAKVFSPSQNPKELSWVGPFNNPVKMGLYLLGFFCFTLGLSLAPIVSWDLLFSPPSWMVFSLFQDALPTKSWFCWQNK